MSSKTQGGWAVTNPGAKRGGFSDRVLSWDTKIDEDEAARVADQWPEELRNILIISIRPDRLERCRQRLGPLGQYVLNVDGVDGTGLDMGHLKQTKQYRPIDKWNHMTKGELGCFLSHRKMWQYAVDHELPYCFILEDDCNLRPSPKVLHLLQTALVETNGEALDLLFVGRDPRLCRAKRRISEHLVEVDKTWGLFAYVVSQRAARALLLATRTMVHPVDVFVSTFRGVSRRLGVTPIPFTVVPEGSDTARIR